MTTQQTKRNNTGKRQNRKATTQQANATQTTNIQTQTKTKQHT